MSSNSVKEIFQESMDKLNSILMYLDHQLGTVSLTEDEIKSLGGVKNEVEPMHTILEEQKGTDKKNKKKEKPKENKEEKPEEKKEEKKEEKPAEEKKEKKNKKKEEKKDGEPKKEENNNDIDDSLILDLIDNKNYKEYCDDALSDINFIKMKKTV